MQIRKVALTDAKRIVEIYNYYIKDTTITFEEEEISKEIMEKRIYEKTVKEKLPWIVLEQDGEVQGYAYAGIWHKRSAYRFTVELSIYLDKKCLHKGFGRTLYTELLNIIKKTDIKNVLGVIALPNEASIHLHETLGFQKVGEFPHVGLKYNQWISVGFWQLEL
jgi:L-amino acid N-acyltransferase YncA